MENSRGNLRIGEARVDLGRGVVWLFDQQTRLSEASCRVLARLLDTPGTNVTREELTRVGWADRTVTRNSLDTEIRKLRRAIGDDARAPHYIVTAPNVGYRLVLGTPKASGLLATPVERGDVEARLRRACPSAPLRLLQSLADEVGTWPPAVDAVEVELTTAGPADVLERLAAARRGETEGLKHPAWAGIARRIDAWIAATPEDQVRVLEVLAPMDVLAAEEAVAVAASVVEDPSAVLGRLRAAGAVRSTYEGWRCHVLRPLAWGLATRRVDEALHARASAAWWSWAERMARELYAMRTGPDIAIARARLDAAWPSLSRRLLDDPPHPATPAVLAHLGEYLRSGGRFAELQPLLTRALASESSPRDKAMLLLLQARVARVHDPGSDTEKRLAEAARDLAASLGEVEIEFDAGITLGSLARRRGSPSESVAMLAELEGRPALRARPAQWADVRDALATACRDTGALHDAAFHAREAVRLARQCGHLDLVATAEGGLAGILERQGLLQEAEAAAGRAIQGAAEVGRPLAAAHARLNRGNVRLALRKLPEADADYADAEAIYAASGDVLAVSKCRMNRGVVAIVAGTLEQAEHLLGEAAVGLRSVGDLELGLLCTFDRAIVAGLHGDVDGARHLVEHTLERPPSWLATEVGVLRAMLGLDAEEQPVVGEGLGARGRLLHCVVQGASRLRCGDPRGAARAARHVLADPQTRRVEPTVEVLATLLHRLAGGEARDADGLSRGVG